MRTISEYGFYGIFGRTLMSVRFGENGRKGTKNEEYLGILSKESSIVCIDLRFLNHWIILKKEMHTTLEYEFVWVLGQCWQVLKRMVQRGRWVKSNENRKNVRFCTLLESSYIIKFSLKKKIHLISGYELYGY